MKVLITSNSFGKFDSKPRRTHESLGWEVVWATDIITL